MPDRPIAYQRPLLPLALLTLLSTTNPSYAGGAAALTAPSTAPATAPQFAAEAFANVWTRTDSPVASGSANRTWFWGPQPNSPGLLEDYAEGTNGKRRVQYFDKSRMEINDPKADPTGTFYVTNGLLTVELISGRMQTGNNTFVIRRPSQTNVTGDSGDTLSPTYAALAGVSNALGEQRDPDRTGNPAIFTLSREGKVSSDPSKASLPGVTVAYYEKSSGHNVPQAMWAFLNSSGPVSVSGNLTNSRLADPWFYASGLPISDAYWVKATIAGKPTDVLLQAYERRILTYVPTNPEGFKVEMGNIGQHYYEWRYGQAGSATPIPAPTQPPPTATPTIEPLKIAPIFRFAVDIVGNTDAANLDRIKSTGAGAVRLQLAWNQIEAENVAPAQYNWAYPDAAFKALADRGLQPITMIVDCPLWACARPSGPIRVERIPDFVEFMKAMATRYSKAPYNAHYWELWNEPDAIGEPTVSTPGKFYSWGTNADRYAAVLKAIRPAVKAADPQAAIILGGIAYDNFKENGGPFNRRFLDDLLDAGGGQYLDAITFHYYSNTINWCSFTDKLEELRAKVRAHGLNLPFISTETGYSSDPARGSSDRIQSLYVLQTYAQTAGEGMLSTAWFLSQDYTTDVVGWQYFDHFGLFDLNGAPKPASSAYRIAADKIGNRPALRVLTAADGLRGTMRGYEFAGDVQHPGKLWILWGWDQSSSAGCGTAPTATDFTIPATSASNLAQALDIYGQPVTLRNLSNSSKVFSLDASPVYLEWKK